MNVGDYVRIINTLEDYVEIIKIKELNEYDGYLLDERNYQYSTYEIIKSSPQIIDLIEVGDFITYKQGNFYWNVFAQVSGRHNRENQITDLIVDNKPLNTVEILTVITHEQMEAMQYRVEE